MTHRGVLGARKGSKACLTPCPHLECAYLLLLLGLQSPHLAQHLAYRRAESLGHHLRQGLAEEEGVQHLPALGVTGRCRRWGGGYT